MSSVQSDNQDYSCTVLFTYYPESLQRTHAAHTHTHLFVCKRIYYQFGGFNRWGLNMKKPAVIKTSQSVMYDGV